ncbi:hypothetical protein [Kingella oralis]|uniref:hypothetical protein n=2 Tax=Kingella oralis TaxID=505 RepID=UPI00206F2475|nr:MAG TPA: hypothetical protein [Caudoviricetes sp.]
MLKIWNKYKFQAACMGLVLACALSAWAGYAVAQSACHAATLLLKNQYADEQLKAQQAYSAALADALAQKQAALQWAQQQGEQLAATRAQLDQQQHELNKEIPHATHQDNQGATVYNGIGERSLQLYNRAFGYTDAD